MRIQTVLLVTLALFAVAHAAANAQTRDEKVLADRDQLAEDDRWIYNDLPRGFAEAKQSDKPLLIVFR